MQSPIGTCILSAFAPQSIRWRFIIFISLTCICALGVTLLWTTKQIRHEAELVAIEKVTADLQLAEMLLDSRYPGDWHSQDGKLYKGNMPINEDFRFTDEISLVTGDTCSIFLGDTRVATTVMREDKRAVGTKLSPEVAEVVLKNGQQFFGEANVVGDKYQTAYTPLRNSSGQVIGIWYVGANKNFVDKMLANTIQQVTLAFFIGWLLIICVAWLLTSSLITSVNKLIAAANRLAAGDLDTRITASSQDEISYLAHAFEQMREKLQLNNQNLETLVNERTAELKLAYAELKQLDDMKSNFLSTVSHELRTPLTSILGFAQLIQKKLEGLIFPEISTSNPRVTKAINQTTNNIGIIISEGQRLTDLINDLLDLAKMESGKTEWRNEPLALKELISRAVNSSESLWAGKDLELIIDVEDNLPAVPGDPDRILQVLLNLLSNAVKFTYHGAITCRANYLGNQLVVSVSDTGIGIPLKDQAMIFEKFKQIGDTLTEKPQGTGLGLPICQQIIEHHGGQMWVESTSGKGSSFFFTLPLTRSAAPNPVALDVQPLLRQVQHHVPKTTQPAGKTKTILIVDDDSHIRTLLHQELETVGYTVLEANDGVQALNQVYEAVERQPDILPDLIILDVMMPKMNGFDVAAALKSNPATQHIPIVILSVVEDQQRGWQAGVNCYLTKPVNIQVLLQEVAALLALTQTKTNILIVDDDQEILDTLTKALTNSGFTVCSASDIQACLREAHARQPGVIIIDSRLSAQSNIIQALQQEQGLENVFFLLLAKLPADNNASSAPGAPPPAAEPADTSQ